jgi:hypothetical protein
MGGILTTGPTFKGFQSLQNRIEVKRRIRIEVKHRIRIRIKMIWIPNTAEMLLVFQAKGVRMFWPALLWA